MMRVLMMLMVAGLLAACSDPRQEVTTQLAEQVLLPAHQQWRDTNAAMLVAAEGVCAGELDAGALRQAFHRTQQSWSYLQPLMVGPMAEGSRSWQVQFWPDKRNMVASQVEQLLDTASPLTQSVLDDASVVVQGLSAMEYVLFDEAVDLASGSDRYCPLLTGIARHQRALSDAVLGQWKPERDANGGADDSMLAQLTRFPNDRYASADDALAGILRTQTTAVDVLKKKLGTPMGRLNKGVPQPWQAEAWRSRHSVANLQASLDGARAVWERVRSLVGNAELVTRIDTAYDDVASRLEALPGPLVALVQDPDAASQLDDLYESIDTLENLQQGELARDLGIQIGFNANDGD